MKLFIYKILIVFFLTLILFKLTIGSLIRNYESKVDLYFTKDNLSLAKDKLREEMKNAIEIEQYLKPEDAKLINDFLKKIQKEISVSNE